LVALLLLWALLGIAWRLLRWPFGALSKRHRRVSRARLAQGLVALYEGRHGEAERALGRAAKHAPLRAPALLAAADAARRRGDSAGALQTLDEATQEAPQAARVLRARTLREAGRADEAVQLLAAEAEAGKLSPAGWLEWVEATLADGQPQRARAALEPLRKSAALDSRGYAGLESRVLLAAVDAAPDGTALAELWRNLSRAQRNDPALITAYAHRAAATGSSLAAMDEIESALRRHWDATLVGAYADLAGDHPEQRLRHAEAWLGAHAQDAALLTALGRMCVRQGLWGKARDYLERALAADPDAPGAWRALGDAALGQGDAARAADCYRHALDGPRASRTSTALPPATTQPTVLDERNEHGLPRLPAAQLHVDDEGA
jgi:HemY protein